MRIAFGSLWIFLGVAGECVLQGGCALQSAMKPVEYLDESTATTVGALAEPIEFAPSEATVAAARGMTRKHISFAYLGPVEWDKAGEYKYGLWMHVAAGSNWTPADIRSPGDVTLVLDEETRALEPMDAPQLGVTAYHPVASWGQTAYFELTVDMLRRMAASRKLDLDVRGTDGRTMSFVPESDTRAVLSLFLSARSLTGD